MTPSDLAVLDGCFRFFHWTRILGMNEPGNEPSGDTPQMKLGSIAHKLLESGTKLSDEVLQAAAVPDLASVFQSQEWRDLAGSFPERELPFIMYLNVDGKDCWIRGRMDAAVASATPRVIDYKYAMWRESGEAVYDIQMTAYALALMKAVDTDRAISELWFLKSPMKIVRREYKRGVAEARLTQLFSRYFRAVETDQWPAAERTHCDQVECGFRQRCWGEQAD
jgi:hypothetical protein